VNSVSLGTHENSQLPFWFRIDDGLMKHGNLTVVVKIGTRLNETTIPPGSEECYTYQNGKQECNQDYQQDFYNYCGIHRQVRLITTPKFGVINQEFRIIAFANGTLVRLPDINTIKHVKNSKKPKNNNTENTEKRVGAILNSVTANKYKNEELARKNQGSLTMKIYDEDDNLLTGTSATDTMHVRQVKKWYPRGYGAQPLYKLVIYNETDEIVIKNIGFRDILTNSRGIFVNGLHIKINGIGRHEDWVTRGKGYDPASLIRDFNLMKWLNLNTFRTSHYPYNVETMDLASKLGFMVISELPNVGMKKKVNFGTIPTKLALKLQKTLIGRDFNYPCVVMWSLGNEPNSYEPLAANFFKRLAKQSKKFDATRPITVVVQATDPDRDLVAGIENLDVIMSNSYSGWYHLPNFSENVLKDSIMKHAVSWLKKYPEKPFIHSEWGAGAVSGLHSLPSSTYSEDYQAQIVRVHHKAFMELWSEYDNFAGHMLWQFADFETHDGARRVSGNRKGVFTRDREPKEAAYVFKKLFRQLNGFSDEWQQVGDENIGFVPNSKLGAGSKKQLGKRFDDEVYRNLKDLAGL